MPENPLRKVLFVLPDLSAGGAERVLITLMNNLNRACFTPSIIGIMKKDTLAPLIDTDIPCDSLGKSSLITAIPALYKKLSAMNPDIVVSTMAPMNFVLLLLRPLFPKTKFVIREAIVPTYILGRHPWLKPFLRFAYKHLYAMATIIISPSEQIKNELMALGLNEAPHVLLYNPVDESTVPQSEDSGNGKTIKYIASGRLKHQKGFDRLIEALEGFNPPFEWSLSILGEGEEKESLKALISKHGLKHHITLCGHVSSPLSFYKSAHIFLLPSRWEGMPNVALESLACGTPVIAIKEAGGMQEIASLSQQGAIYIANDIRDFVNIMKRVANIQRPEKTSLLPEQFKLARINAQFAKILSDI
jgi:glycosyltransferase involved in cell wall biosynthesis